MWGQCMSKTRDFSEDRWEILLSQISEINEEQWCGVTDFLGDIGSKVFSVFGFLNIENYLTNIEEYHKKIMDQRDTTQQELCEIFEAVGSVDREYLSEYLNISSAMDLHMLSLRTMSDLINPSTGSFTAEKIEVANKEIAKKTKMAEASINTVFDAQLDYAEKKALKNATKDFVGDILNIAGNCVSLGLNILSGNIPGAAADIWQIVNDSFTMINDAEAMLILGYGMTSVAASDSKTKNQKRQKLLAKAEKARQIEGVSGELESRGFTTASNIVSGVDIAATGISVVSDFKNMGKSAEKVYGDAKEISKYVTDGRYNTTKRVTEKVLGMAGIDVREKAARYRDAAKFADKLQVTGQQAKEVRKIYRTLDKQKNIVSSAKTIYKGMKAVDNGDTFLGEILSNTSVAEFAKDTRIFFDGIEDDMTRFFMAFN